MKLQPTPAHLKPTASTMTGFGFDSMCKRGMEKYSESMSAFFGRKGGDIHFNGKKKSAFLHLPGEAWKRRSREDLEKILITGL